MWFWILHRFSGLAVLGFLFLHILDTSLIGFGPEHYNKFVEIYKGVLFRWLEVALLGFVIFHSLNGVRILIIDFWSKGSKYAKQLQTAVVVSSLGLFIPASYFMLRTLFE